MKTIVIFLCVFYTTWLQSQINCQNAAPFCAGGVSGVTYPASINSGAAQSGPNYGCLLTQPNPAWYYLQVANPGNLIILIQGQMTSPPGPGQDVDFICWGPFSSLSNVCNSLTASNIVDCSYSPSFTETLTIPSGLTGQYYLVLITNFANATQNISFNQIGGTGNTNCSLVSSNYSVCMGSSLTIGTTPPLGLSNLSYTLLPNNVVSQTPSFVVSPAINTSYSIVVSGLTSQNIVTSQTAVSNVTVNPAALFSPTVSNATCASAANSFSLGLHFNPPNSSPTYTVVWNNIPVGVNSPTQVSANGGIIPGPYTASVTVAGGCTAIANFTIEPIPATANFMINPPAPVYSITCYQPSLSLQASNSNNTYTWSNNGAPYVINSFSASINYMGQGTWTVHALNQLSGCVASRTIIVVTNTQAPISSVTPSMQTITCNLTSVIPVTLVASPGVNIQHAVTGQQGATYYSPQPITVYNPFGSGTYTHCVVNTINGCSACQVFTVNSSQGFPVFNLTSPQNYTLGCSSKSVAQVQIINANSTPPGGALSYTALAPGASTMLSGNLSTIGLYNISVPGTWTIVTRDNNNFCETRIPVSIISNTAGPNLTSLSVPQTILDCRTPSVVLEAYSDNPAAAYNWQYKSGTQTLNQLTSTVLVQANFLNPKTVLISNYTMSITDQNNLCVTNTVVTMSQNIFVPNTGIKAGSVASITCISDHVVLNNSSTTGIPSGLGLINSAPVVAALWKGPSPQTESQFYSSYVAYVPGIYTLQGLDLNNGCVSTATLHVGDNRIYPLVNQPPVSAAILDCGEKITALNANVQGNQTNLEYTWIPPLDAVYTGTVKDKIFHVSSLGIYRVVVKDLTNGCTSSGVDSVKSGMLSGDIAADVYRGFAPLTVNFINHSRSTLDSSQIKTYWTFANGKSQTTMHAGSKVSTEFTAPGTYTVNAFVMKGDCRASATETIIVDVPSNLEVPNIFTPNGDHVNDEFFLKANNLIDIQVKIYDRWGNMVYMCHSDKGNVTWDGKNANGQTVSEGVYFYTLIATGADDRKYSQSGNVTVAK
jgi:gliding motility-associated-like protein